MTIDRKVLRDLKAKGWKDAEIKYSQFRIYVKDNFGVLYDKKTDTIVRKYYRGKNDKL